MLTVLVDNAKDEAQKQGKSLVSHMQKDFANVTAKNAQDEGKKQCQLADSLRSSRR